MSSVPAARRPSIIPGILLGVLALILFAIGARSRSSTRWEGAVARKPPRSALGRRTWRLAAARSISPTTSVAADERSVSSITCDVVNGGATQTLVTNPFVSEESGSMELIATFSAVAVRHQPCSWIDGHDSTRFFLIAAGVPVPAIVLFILGDVVLVLGGLLILRAVLAGRRR